MGRRESAERAAESLAEAWDDGGGISDGVVEAQPAHSDRARASADRSGDEVERVPDELRTKSGDGKWHGIAGYLSAIIEGYLERESGVRANRMRDWAEFCEREADPEKRIAVFSALFGSYEYPQFSQEKKSRVRCEACNDDGFVFSEACRPRQRNYHNRSGSGFVACDCPMGNVRNMAISEMGRKKPERKRPSREEF